MKKTIKLALVAALALGATSAFATNGSNLIGTGAKSRAMGGTSIGIGHGAESGLSNPALIYSIKKDNEISFGGTLFMPSVNTDGGMASFGSPAVDSAADINVIPEVSIATKVNDNFYWGIGMYGTAGMGVDYRDAATNPGSMGMVTNLQLMQFGVPLTFVTNGFSIGVVPILQYGSLDMQYNYDSTMDGSQDAKSGGGVSQDLSFGYNIGIAYQISGLTIGAIYKSEIEMDYNGQLSSATTPFVNMGIFPAASADTLSTPSEIGVGLSYSTSGHTIAADYKQINWSDADGYSMFQWDDQSVMALGYEFAQKNWAVRLGYNYASNPITDAGAMNMADAGMNMGMYAGNAINTFNLAGFPATTESHITLGGSYSFNEVTTLDFAYTYAPETTTSLQTMPYMNMSAPTMNTDLTTTVTHSQTALSFQLSYAF